MLGRNVVPDMADLAKHVGSVDVVANSDDPDNVSLVVDDPAVGAWDDSSWKVYSFLIIVERLEVGIKIMATLFVPFPIFWFVGGIVVQHPQECVAVGLVESSYGHGRVHYSRDFENALK